MLAEEEEYSQDTFTDVESQDEDEKAVEQGTGAQLAEPGNKKGEAEKPEGQRVQILNESRGNAFS